MTQPMPEQRLAAIEASYAAADVGPWPVEYDHDDDTGQRFPIRIGPFRAIEQESARDEANAKFVELARMAVPEMAAEIRVLQAAVDQAGRGAALAARDHRRRAEIESLRTERDEAQAAVDRVRTMCDVLRKHPGLGDDVDLVLAALDGATEYPPLVAPQPDA